MKKLEEYLRRSKMDVNQFNIEVGLFLRCLRLFSEQKNVHVIEKTAEMLIDMVETIERLIATVDIRPTTDDKSVNFVFDLNERDFDIRHYIMCRMCIEQIGITKEDFEAHLRKSTHKVHEVKENQKNQENLPTTKKEVAESIECNASNDRSIQNSVEIKLINHNTAQ